MTSEITPSQTAWNRFADRLKEVGEKIVGPMGARSARERADGFRYLTSLVAGGYELCLLYTSDAADDDRIV